MTVAYPTNITFAYDNVVFDATTITPGSEVPTMPAENLRLQERGAFWRTTGKSSEALAIVLPQPKPFNILGLIDHTLTRDATVRVQANNDNNFSGATPYDETFTVGADLASAKGYDAPEGKVAPPAVFFLDPGLRTTTGNAVLLGADDAFSAASHADLKPTTAFSVGAWIKKNGCNDIAGIFSSFAIAGGVYAGWQLFISSVTGKVLFQSGKNTGAGSGDVKTIIGSTMVCDDEWHFIVATWDGSYLNLYVDGTPDATPVAWANAPAYQATNYVKVGCLSGLLGANTYFFKGSLDDVFLYNGTALSATAVGDIYNNGITVTTNLKAQYAFASGALTVDSSGNNHTLTAISVPVDDPDGGVSAGLKKFKYVKLTFSDINNTASYLQLGVLWLGTYLESEQTYNYGITDTLVDPSTVAQSMGGQDWPDEEEMYLQLSFTLGRLSDAAKYYDFRQMFFAVRKTRFFILMLQPATAFGRALMSAYGRFTENTKFSQAFNDDNTLDGLEFKEVR